MESTVEYVSHGCEIDEGWTIQGGGAGGSGTMRDRITGTLTYGLIFD